jgi:molecular chaperone DnaK (HSP70)
MSTFVVGIDLGTTNSALASVPVASERPEIEPVPIPQVVAPGEVDERATLPSFLLLPTALEVPPEAMMLPWGDGAQPGWVVGEMARERGSDLPHRLVSSAKSWLSFGGVDRSAAILPWRGADADEDEEAGEDRRISPVEASARYLAHIRAAWDTRHPGAPLGDQEVLLTVPASFDAVARELTVTAARQAGLEKLTLLEEPQAAFYSFLAHAGDNWRKQLRPGDVVVVIDVGGGTCDFSLIAVSEESGNLQLERVAVGDHILLGGDNMDLTLAHAVTQRLAADGHKVKSSQYRGLVHACRRAKEVLLGAKPPKSVPITILGGGSKLIGGTLKSKLDREDVEKLLVDGFAPEVPADATPRVQRALGLRELGLPYATDPAVTRHLASFLARHGRQPTAILFNGGVMKGALLRKRITEVVASWYGGEVRVLEGTDLDLAVAHGAAYYGLVRQGRGIRIRGGTARAYYIGVESAMPAIPGFSPPVKALCVAPFGMEEGTRVEVPGQELGLLVGEPTEFRFFASTNRKDDRTGQIVDPDEEELIELAPVLADLPAGDRPEAAGQVVPVTLAAHVTEIGTLELWSSASDGRGRWKLEYSLREGSSDDQ